MPYGHTSEHFVFERLHEWQDQAQQQQKLSSLRKPYLSHMRQLIETGMQRTGSALSALTGEKKRAAESIAIDKDVE